MRSTPGYCGVSPVARANLDLDLNGDGTVDATFVLASVTSTVVAGAGGDDRLTVGNGLGGAGVALSGGPGDDTSE
jgi:hypothetical protein